MIRYSLSSTVTSLPAYLPNRIVSPALTSRATTVPSSFFLPLPTATTFPCCGFSFAESGMMIRRSTVAPPRRALDEDAVVQWSETHCG